MTRLREASEVRSANNADMPTYMRPDKAGYKFVRPIPEPLQAHFGKKNFIKRLGKDFKAAKLALAELVVETNRLLKAAYGTINTTSSIDDFLCLNRTTRLKKITYSSDLAGSISSLWLQSLDADSAARASGERSEEEIESLEKNIPSMLGMIRKAISTGHIDKFHSAIDQLLILKGYQLHATDEQWQELTYKVLQAFLVGYKVLNERQQGEQLDSVDVSGLPPALTAAWEEQIAFSKKSKVSLLSDITASYAEYLENQNEKTRSTKLSIYKRFIDFVGDQPSDNITSTDIYNFIEHRINTEDSQWSHAYATGRAKNALLEAFGRGKTMRLVKINPVNDVEILPKRNAKKEKLHKKPRYPYSSNQLNSLFASDWYKPQAPNWKGRMQADLGARYWIPLICLFHGLRVTEAAQRRCCINARGTACKLRV